MALWFHPGILGVFGLLFVIASCIAYHRVHEKFLAQFKKLEEMTIAAPHIPPISNIMDTSNFDSYDFDPHGGEGDVIVMIDPSGGGWVDGF